jgi:hypothetical protein
VAFLSADQLASLQINRIIFHVVGTDDENPILLDEMLPGDFGDFFLDRLRSTANGMMYDFLPASGVLASLKRVVAQADRFIEESKNLARTFHEAHTGSTSPGALVVFSLSSNNGAHYALIKFDHEEVLSYKVTTTGGVNRVQLNKLLNTFVKHPEAMQKSALIRLTDDGGELSIRDRAGKGKASNYYAAWLGVKRRHTATDLTKKIVEIATGIARDFKDELPADIYRNARHRIYDAVQQMEAYDPLTHDFLNAVFGPAAAAPGSPLRDAFSQRMRTARIEDEPFEFDRKAVSRPTKRRITTQEGVVVTYDENAQNTVRIENIRNGNARRIIIETGSLREDDIP